MGSSTSTDGWTVLYLLLQVEHALNTHAALCFAPVVRK